MSRIIPFSRPGPANYTDAAGIVRTAGPNVERTDHHIFPGPQRITLHEPRSVNSCLWSREPIAAHASWGLPNMTSALMNAVGIDGTPNTGCTLTDNNVGARASWSQQMNVLDDSSPITLSYYILKDNTNLYRRLGGSISQGVPGHSVLRQIYFNSKTGDSGINQLGGNDSFTSHRVVDGGLFWIVELVYRNNRMGNTLFAWSGIPCYAATNGGAEDVTLQGSIVLLHTQVELNRDSFTSPIFTTVAAAVREGDIEQHMSNTVDPIDLRQDSVTGVLFDANDPLQVAAHPNSKPASVGKGDTTIRDGYAIKNPSPIAGRAVRPDLDSPKRGQK